MTEQVSICSHKIEYSWIIFFKTNIIPLEGNKEHWGKNQWFRYKPNLNFYLLLMLTIL